MNRILSLGFPLFLLLICLPQNLVVNGAGQGLVSPQSNCRIRCENGGMCVFDLDRPNVHSCICLLGVFSGDRCQYRIAPLDETDQPASTTSAPNYSHDEETRRLEEEQRKREYERVIAERTRKEKEERERAQSEEMRRQQYWKEETARREKERQDAEKRREEERVRNDERRRQYEAERAREEERRREAETRRMQEEEERARASERLKEADEESARKMAEKQAEAINEQWEYRDGDDEDYPQVAEKDEYDEGIEEEGMKKEEEVQTIRQEDNGDSKQVDDVAEDDVEEIRPEDETVISSISSVFDKAVEETIKEHPVEEESMKKSEEVTEKDGDDHQDDYWDHTPKKTDEDYERDGEEARISKTKSEDIEEYGMEEGQEGWMMVKKEQIDENSGPILRLELTLISLFLFSLIFW